jgi:hypothetical protein
MSRKIKVTPEKGEMPEKEGRQTPVLGLFQGGRRELVCIAKKRAA